MSFWQLSDNSSPDGSAESSHVKPMSVIPDGTCAPGQIKDFMRVEPNENYGSPVYEVIVKLTSGDYKSREVKLKIKCFDPKPNIADRGINLLKRIYDLCNYKPTHNNAPTNDDLHPMIGKIIGVKIAEFIGTNSKTGEPTNGNYISEVHAADKDFETMTGVKLDVYVSPVPSALNRNERAGQLPLDDSGIPF